MKKGHKHSEEAKIKMSQAGLGKNAGEKNCNWKGGIAEYPNHYFLKKQRLEALRRASGKCEICGNIAIIVHHINGQKDNHELNNLIVLCNKCHHVLHREDIGHGIRTSKYIRQYGLTLNEIAGIFHTKPATIYYRLKNPATRIEIEKRILGGGKAG